MNTIQHWGYWPVEFFLIHLAIEHPLSNSWAQASLVLALLGAGFLYARYAGGWLTDQYNTLPPSLRTNVVRLGMGLSLCLPVVAVWFAVRLFLN